MRLNKILDNYEPQITILPRTPDEVYMPIQSIKKKIVWSFPLSIWAKKYKFDTEEHIRKCSERDWNCTKITKFLKLPE